MMILMFQSIHFVLKAESFFRKAGIELEMIPTPKHLSSECGMSVKIAAKFLEQSKQILSEKNIQFRVENYEI